jgi:UDP-glucose 4-epimerase
MNQKAVLLFGGSGFIGSSIANRLASSPDQKKIIVVGRSASPNYALSARVEYISGDLKNLDFVKNLLKRADEVIDLSCDTNPITPTLNAATFLQTHVAPVLSRMEASLQFNLKRYLYFSSGGAIYGNTKTLPICEEAPKFPISQYGLEKLYCENYSDYLKKIKNFPVVILRPSNPYGITQIGSRGQGFIGAAVNNIINLQPVVIYGDVGKTRDYLYMDDLVDAVIALAETNISSGVFNVGTGVGLNNAEVLEVIQKEIEPYGYKVTKRHESARAFDVEANILNPEKLMKTTGWRPKINIGTGVAKLIKAAMQKR